MKRDFLLKTSLAALLGATAICPMMASASAYKPMNVKNQKLVAAGKKIVMQKNCTSCHGANLVGKPHFAPTLHPKGPLRHYNNATFARLMSRGLDEGGKPVHKPMPTYNMKAADSAAVYAYLKTLK